MASPAGIAVFFPCNTATTVAVSTCTAFIVAATGVYDAFSIAVATDAYPLSSIKALGSSVAILPSDASL